VTIRPPGAPRETFTAATEAEARARFAAWLTGWRQAGGALRPAWDRLCPADARAPLGTELAQMPPAVGFAPPAFAGAAGPVCQVGHVAPLARAVPQPYAHPAGAPPPWLHLPDATPVPRRTVGFQPARRLLQLVDEWHAAARAGWHSARPRARTAAAATLDRQRIQIRAALKHLEWREPADVRPGTFARWLDALRNGQVFTRGTQPRHHLAQATLYAYRQSLQTFCDWLADAGKIPQPVYLPFVEPHHAPRDTRHAAGDSERLCAVLRRYCTTPQRVRADGARRRVPFKLAGMILRDTAIRRATLARLVRADFILPPAPATRGAYLKVRAITEKNQKDPQPGLRADTVRELRAVLAEEAYGPHELIWGRISARGLLEPRIKIPTWNRWLRRAKCPPDAQGRYGCHALRHARRSVAVNRTRTHGADLGLADVMLDAEGHRDPANLRTYLVDPGWARAQQLAPEAPLPVTAGAFAVAPDGSFDFTLTRPDGSTARAHLHAGSPEWSRQVGFLETDLGALALSPIGGKTSP
jgi:hypothetical protein